MGRLIVANEAVVVIGAILQMLIGKKNRPLGSKGIAKYLLGWSLPLNVGLMGIQFFLGHTARAEKTAEGLGWPSGNPF